MRIDAQLPAHMGEAVRHRLADWDSDDAAGRFWARDPTLWTDDPVEQSQVAGWQGWLDVVPEMEAALEDLTAFSRSVWADGITEVLLLGMGGSSLCPEVLARTWPGTAVRLTVLDTTHADHIGAVLGRLAPASTLVVVSSKSGSTLETECLMECVWEHYAHVPGRERHFVAVTDAKSSLDAVARERGFRRVFNNRADIGGRYSALSNFGMVPAALAGVDVGGLLKSAAAARVACGSGEAAHVNPGLRLGAILGEAALAGKDKATLLCAAPVISLGVWLEQLIAESTGKHGRGIVPVPDHAASPASFGSDRIFVATTLADHPDPDFESRLDLLVEAGHPVVRCELESRIDLGAAFFTWEVAVAMAGTVLRINPFDQPNVQESKDNTRRVLEQGVSPVAAGPTPAELLDRLAPPHYLSIQAYVAPSPEVGRAFLELQSAVRMRFRSAATFGYGPRFLHSTGQLHKGGPAEGVFVQVFMAPERDLAIPGKDFTFGTLIAAQAEGDLESLRARGLQVARVTVGSDPAEVLQALAEAAGAVVAG
ncbi:MAG: glucose-6-phosphate isomerase [Candidatus Dormibacteria bacterium]